METSKILLDIFSFRCTDTSNRYGRYRGSHSIINNFISKYVERDAFRYIKSYLNLVPNIYLSGPKLIIL